LGNYILKAGDTMTGNLGIGKTNPNCRLYIDSANGNNTSTTFSIRIGSNGNVTDGGAFPNLIGLGIEANGWSKGAIGWLRTGPYDQGDIVFLNRNTIDSADTNMSYERMRISSGGNVNISNTLSVNGHVNINNNSKLIFNNNIDDMRIQLWEGYGFGINGGTLRYNTMGNHTFFINGGEIIRFNSTGMGFGNTNPKSLCI
jgi:hypothetical protein